jgi:hypothetical protein
LGPKINGFHIPREFNGRTIIIEWPDNEHAIFAVEDLLKIVDSENDILVGQSDGINNAFAVVDNSGTNARRMIVYDPVIFAGRYRLVLSHEVGHHLCRHTIEAFRGHPWDKELEADRTGAALLRIAHDKQTAIGGQIIDLDDVVSAGNAIFSPEGSDTHPPRNQRIQALLDGWNNGSPCLNKKYVPINPIRVVPSAVEETAFSRGESVPLTDNEGGTYRALLNGKHISIVISRPSPELAARGARQGDVIFEGEGGGDGTKEQADLLSGNMTDFHQAETGCPAPLVPAGGRLHINNDIELLVSHYPLRECTPERDISTAFKYVLSFGG